MIVMLKFYIQKPSSKKNKIEPMAHPWIKQETIFSKFSLLFHSLQKSATDRKKLSLLNCNLPHRNKVNGY